MSLETLKECPVCKSHDFKPFLICKDHTTTKETFELRQCDQCAFVVTSPRPDQLSLSKYYDSEKYISHTGASSGIIDSVYLLARRFTLRWKANLVARHAKNQPTLLDYGCGTGEFLKTCSARGWKSFGVEPSALARPKASNNNLITVQRSIEELPEIKFDAITLWHVLEHVDDLEKKIDQLKNLLADNGTLFVAVPNRTAYDALVFQEHWAAYDVPRHLWHFSIENMELLMSQSKLSIKEIKPMKLDAYYVSLLSQKYKTGKFTILGALKALSIAFMSNAKARNTNLYSSLIYIIKK
jgi:2-polyprenyl-3-methyl-5-hydroxy-6-metoxy-1,4-benzoquinol methylase